jgi:hypothetical protein
VGCWQSSPGDRNCADFDSHAQAQRFFERHGGSASSNVDGLDGDSDGRACENHEYSGSGGGGNNNPDPAPEEEPEEEPAEEEPEPEMPDSSTTSPGSGTSLPLLLSVLGIGTFGLMLRRRFAVHS